MHFTTNIKLVLLALMSASLLVTACKGETAPPEKIDFKTAEKEADGVVESVIPSPDTIFLAMDALGSPKWDNVLTAVEKESFESETQTALATGIHLAQFFVNVHTKNKEGANKSVDAVVRSAKQLKLEIDAKDEKSVRKDIKAGKWDALRKSLSDLNGKMSDDLVEKKKRPDLVMLISIGAYLEGTYVAAKVLSAKYSKKSAVIMSQGPLINDVKKSAENTLKKGDKYTKIILTNLKKLGKLMKVKDNGAVSEANTKKILEVVTAARAEVLK